MPLDASLVAAYLHRLGVSTAHSPQRPGEEEALLRLLHRRHVHSVPFENLDTVLLSRRIPLCATTAARKIASGRGGFCYELNGAFGELLTSLGFGSVSFLPCRVHRGGGEFGPPLSHVALLVSSGGSSAAATAATSWFCDVGSTRVPVEPVAFAHGAVQSQGQDGEAFMLWRLGEGQVDADGNRPCGPRDDASGGGPVPAPGETWRLLELIPHAPPAELALAQADVDAACAGVVLPPGYSARCVLELSTTSVPFQAFEDRCALTQTSPESVFTKGLVCALRVPGADGGRLGGRVALLSGPWAGREGIPPPADPDPTAAAGGTGTGTTDQWAMSERDRPNGERRVTRLVGRESLLRVLRSRFGIVLTEGEDGGLR